jgi:hypothetical protein
VKTPWLRFRVYVAGIIKSETWVNTAETTPDAAMPIQEEHVKSVVAAEAAGQKWLIEVHDPDAGEENGYIRFGTDNSAMCDPIPLNEAPRSMQAVFSTAVLRRVHLGDTLEHQHGPRNIDDAFANLPEQDDYRRITNLQLPEPFTCPRCGRTSHNHADRVNGWCGNCQAYTAPPNAEAAQ